jgi:hypothetical protein
MNKNLCGKTRKMERPYEVWTGDAGDLGTITYLVLKKYQSPEDEAGNQFARWFVAAKSDATYGTFEMGDSYIHEIKMVARRVWVDDGNEMPAEVKQLIAA